MPEQMSHLFENLRSDLRNLDPAVHGEGLAAATEYALDDLRSIEEQLEAVTRVAEAAKTYRDVRGDYSWVQMIQALDAWEHPNPASGGGTSSAEGGNEANAAAPRVSSPASVPKEGT